MSTDNTQPNEEPSVEDAIPEDTDPETLVAELELLREENQRLRAEYARARQSRYRRTALGLIAIGVLAIIGGGVFPTARTVLLALGATGLFAGLLTYYLTPERFIAAPVGEGIYRALADNGAALTAELGLQDDHIYIPLGADAASDRNATLFVPQHTEYDLPDPDALDSLFVVTDDARSRGVSLRPSGDALIREFEQALTAPLANDPATLADQLADGLVEQFELADTAIPEIDADNDQITVGIDESAYGAVNRFDHPVASFLAVGFAIGLDRPITLDTIETDDRHDYLITCGWSIRSES